MGKLQALGIARNPFFNTSSRTKTAPHNAQQPLSFRGEVLSERTALTKRSSYSLGFFLLSLLSFNPLSLFTATAQAQSILPRYHQDQKATPALNTYQEQAAGFLQRLQLGLKPIPLKSAGILFAQVGFPLNEKDRTPVQQEFLETLDTNQDQALSPEELGVLFQDIDQNALNRNAATEGLGQGNGITSDSELQTYYAQKVLLPMLLEEGKSIIEKSHQAIFNCRMRTGQVQLNTKECSRNLMQNQIKGYAHGQLIQQITDAFAQLQCNIKSEVDRAAAKKWIFEYLARGVFPYVEHYDKKTHELTIRYILLEKQPETVQNAGETQPAQSTPLQARRVTEILPLTELPFPRDPKKPPITIRRMLSQDVIQNIHTDFLQAPNERDPIAEEKLKALQDAFSPESLEKLRSAIEQGVKIQRLWVQQRVETTQPWCFSRQQLSDLLKPILPKFHSAFGEDWAKPLPFILSEDKKRFALGEFNPNLKEKEPTQAITLFIKNINAKMQDYMMTGASDRAISIEYTALLLGVITHEYFHAYQHQLVSAVEGKNEEKKIPEPPPLNTQKLACINAYGNSFKALLCIENSLILFGSDVNYSETPVEASAYQIQSGMYYHVLNSLLQQAPEQKAKRD